MVLGVIKLMCGIKIKTVNNKLEDPVFSKHA